MHPRFTSMLLMISTVNTDSLICQSLRISKHLLHRSKLIFPHSRTTCSISIQALTAKNTQRSQLLHTVNLTQRLSWLVSALENTLLELWTNSLDLGSREFLKLIQNSNEKRERERYKIGLQKERFMKEYMLV